MSSTLYNVTTTFMGLGYTDINIWYFLTAIAILLFVTSVVIQSKIPYDKFVLSLLSFVIMIGCLFMSANVASYTIQPQWTENTTYYDTSLIQNKFNNYTVSHNYNGSYIDVIPMNSLPLSVISFIMTLFMFANFVLNLLSIIETKDVKDIKMKVEANND